MVCLRSIVNLRSKLGFLCKMFNTIPWGRDNKIVRFKFENHIQLIKLVLTDAHGVKKGVR